MSASRCPIHFEHDHPEDLRWVAFTSRLFGRSRIRTLANKHGLSIEEKRAGWVTTRFVFRGLPGNLNAFCQDVWDDDYLGVVFRREAERYRLQCIQDAAAAADECPHAQSCLKGRDCSCAAMGK